MIFNLWLFGLLGAAAICLILVAWPSYLGEELIEALTWAGIGCLIPFVGTVFTVLILAGVFMWQLDKNIQKLVRWIQKKRKE